MNTMLDRKKAENFFTAESSHESGGVIQSLLVLLILVSIAAATVAYVFGVVVPVGSVGVRKIAFGPGQGLSAQVLKPGFHWTIPGYSTIYEVPQTVRIIDFERDVKAYPASFGSLDVPTVDGTTVNIDVAVLYRFYPEAGTDSFGAHGGAADLINQVGATEVQWGKYLSQISDNELKRSLSSLSTAEFYDPKAREERVKVAADNLRRRLAAVGVRLQGVLLRRYTYRDEIDQAIFKKNLQELESAYNKVAGEFAEAQRDVNKVDSEGAVTIQNLAKQGGSEAEKIRSEGDLYRREKIAQGDLLVAEAMADVDRMRAEVLSKSGGDVYVALQLAQLLGTLKGGVVSNVDPYDFDSWVKRLTGSSSAQQGVLTDTVKSEVSREVK
jgi:regulator of protease activity HflC (stomatin/prohibitin superfamily)